MLYLAYGAGMRVGEIIALKRNDVCFERKQIFVEKGKGNKDRYVTLPSVLEALLLEYISVHKPSYWMFEGQQAGKPCSNSSLQKIVKKAVFLAGITKRVKMHTFRHSYATHLHEIGTDIKLVQELLGHKDIKTTLIYLHVSNRNLQQVRSPLDNLGFDILVHCIRFILIKKVSNSLGF